MIDKVNTYRNVTEGKLVVAGKVLEEDFYHYLKTFYSSDRSYKTGKDILTLNNDISDLITLLREHKLCLESFEQKQEVEKLIKKLHTCNTQLKGGYLISYPVKFNNPTLVKLAKLLISCVALDNNEIKEKAQRLYKEISNYNMTTEDYENGKFL